MKIVDFFTADTYTNSMKNKKNDPNIELFSDEMEEEAQAQAEALQQLPLEDRLINLIEKSWGATVFIDPYSNQPMIWVRKNWVGIEVPSSKDKDIVLRNLHDNPYFFEINCTELSSGNFLIKAILGSDKMQILNSSSAVH